MPVINEYRIVGTITEESIIQKLSSNIMEEKVEDVMDPPLPMVSEETNVSAIRSLLERRQGVLVTKGRKVVGIITRSDFLKTIG